MNPLRIVGWSVVALLVIVGVCYVFWPNGTRSRVDAVGDKVVDAIDNLIGKTEVACKDIENGLQDLEKTYEGIRKAKITAKVKSDMVKKEALNEQETAERTKAALAKLDPHLKGVCGCPEGQHKIGGDIYTTKEINSSVSRLVSLYKTAAAKLETLNQVAATLDNVVQQCETQQSQVSEKIERLRAKNEELKAKVIALKAVRSSVGIMGMDSQLVAQQVAAIEGKINDMLVDVDTNLKINEEQWNEVNSGLGKADGLLDNLANDSLPDEVDKILGNAAPAMVDNR